MTRVLRPYHYLTVAKEDREDPRLVRERVKCGKPSCRCAQDVRHRHGPYIYLRYEEFDRRTQRSATGANTYPRASWRGCGSGSDAPGLPAPVGARSWASYAATSGGWCITNGAAPGCGPLNARSWRPGLVQPARGPSARRSISETIRSSSSTSIQTLTLREPKCS